MLEVNGLEHQLVGDDVVDSFGYAIEQEEINWNEIGSADGGYPISEIDARDVRHLVVESKPDALMQAGEAIGNWSP